MLNTPWACICMQVPKCVDIGLQKERRTWRMNTVKMNTAKGKRIKQDDNKALSNAFRVLQMWKPRQQKSQDQLKKVSAKENTSYDIQFTQADHSYWDAHSYWDIFTSLPKQGFHLGQTVMPLLTEAYIKAQSPIKHSNTYGSYMTFTVYQCVSALLQAVNSHSLLPRREVSETHAKQRQSLLVLCTSGFC